MIEPLDIFRLEKDGTAVWKGTADNFDAAKSRVRALGTLSPGDYVILDQATGFKTVVKVDGPTKHSSEGQSAGAA
jgi:hypothetical protein